MIGKEYLRLLRSARVQTVSFGYGGVTLLDPSEIHGGQIGYGEDARGRSLAGSEDGDWRASWFLIGRDDPTDDPIFIDLEKPLMSVYTAMHGMGEWQPERIADSAAAFLRSLELVHGVSRGRESPVALEQNPLPEAELAEVLRQIRGLNLHSDLNFWRLLLGDTD